MRHAAALLSLAVLPLALAQPTAQPATKPAPSPAEPAKPAATQPATQPAAKPGETKPAETKPAEPAKEAPKPADPYILGYTMKDIDGKDQKLEQYKGKVVLIVNVASKCGLTPQYETLQKLYDSKKDQGLVILAFPANNFASQEPGQDSDIKEFCTSKYGVTFPVFSKISVKGEDQHALFKQLSGQAKPIGGDPTWNFTKFLVNKEGKVVARFEPRTDPSDSTFVKKVEELLGPVAKKTDKPTDKPAEKPADKPAPEDADHGAK